MGEEYRKTEAMRTAAAQEIRRRHDPTTQVSSDGAGVRYHTEGTNREERSGKSAEWSGADTDILVKEEKDETSRLAGGGGGKLDEYSDAAGITGKRSKTATWGHSGRKEQQLGGDLHGHKRTGSGIGRPPWGKIRGKGKGFRLVRKPGRQVLSGGGQGGGPQGLRSGRKPRGGPPGSGRGS